MCGETWPSRAGQGLRRLQGPARGGLAPQCGETAAPPPCVCTRVLLGPQLGIRIVPLLGGSRLTLGDRTPTGRPGPCCSPCRLRTQPKASSSYNPRSGCFRAHKREESRGSLQGALARQGGSGAVCSQGVWDPHRTAAVQSKPTLECRPGVMGEGRPLLGGVGTEEARRAQGLGGGPWTVWGGCFGAISPMLGHGGGPGCSPPVRVRPQHPRLCL